MLNGYEYTLISGTSIVDRGTHVIHFAATVLVQALHQVNSVTSDNLAKMPVLNHVVDQQKAQRRR